MTGRILVFLLLVTGLEAKSQDHDLVVGSISLSSYGYFDQLREYYVSDFVKNMKEEPRFQMHDSYASFMYYYSPAFIISYSEQKSCSNPKFKRNRTFDLGYIPKQYHLLEATESTFTDSNFYTVADFEETRQEAILAYSETYQSAIGPYFEAAAGLGAALLPNISAKASAEETVYYIDYKQCTTYNKSCPVRKLEKYYPAMKYSVSAGIFIPMRLSAGPFKSISVYAEIRPGIGCQFTFNGSTLMKAQFPFGGGIKYSLK